MSGAPSVDPALHVGMGSVGLWGLTPSLDLSLALGCDTRPEGSSAHILILDPADCRHFLATMAGHRLRRGRGELHLYLHEMNPAATARTLLLLAIAGDGELGEQERAELFLEVYGNTLLREKTAEWVSSKVGPLRDLVTDGKPYGPLRGCVDLSLLKHKERDVLDETILAWAQKTNFDIRGYRDTRMRSYLGSRYDARANIFDWDHAMKLSKISPIIHPVHYKHWRETGVAFTVREAVYNVPNRTLRATARGRTGAGRTADAVGFWSDTVNSPYVGFGVASDCEDLFQRRSEQFVKTCVEVSEYNVQQAIHRIETTEEFAGPEAPVAVGEVGEDGAITVDPEVGKTFLHILGFDSELTKLLCGKKRYAQLFDGVYISSTASAKALTDLGECLKPGARCVAERVSYILDLNDEQKKEYANRLTSQLVEGGTWKVRSIDAVPDQRTRDHYLGFERVTGS